MSQKQTRAGTGDSPIHLSLIPFMIPSLCLFCSIPLFPLHSCLSFHSSCLCLALLYLLSFQYIPLSFLSVAAFSAVFSLCACFLLPKVPSLPEPCKVTDFLLLKCDTSQRSARCVRKCVCLWVCTLVRCDISAFQQTCRFLPPWGRMARRIDGYGAEIYGYTR